MPFGPKIVRAYSIASTPRSPSSITLCADVAPDGPGSRWFRALAPGGEVEFKGPLGGFVLGRHGDAACRCSWPRRSASCPSARSLTTSTSVASRSPATLVYGARDAGWLVYDDELRALARRRPGFAYHPIVPTDEPGESGAIASAVDRLVTDVGGLVAYVAGGEATIKRVREVLMAKGLERKAVKWEKFW